VKRKRKFQLYDQGCNVLDGYLDFSNILHKLDELDKLKFIIFNNRQLAMFQFIAKEVCTLQEEQQKRSEINNYKQLAKDNEKLLDILIEYKQDDIIKNEFQIAIDKNL
jgi:hypothetical protein